VGSNFIAVTIIKFTFSFIKKLRIVLFEDIVY